MGKQTDYQLQMMQSLMERMEKHLTNDEVSSLNEDISENTGVGRINYDDLNAFLNSVELNGKFVGLTYVQGYETAKLYPTNSDVETKLRAEYSAMDPSNRLYKKIDSILQNPELKAPTGRAATTGANKGFKSMANTGIQGVLKVTNYVFNWGGIETYDKFLEKKRLDMAELRRKYGFGEEESFYDSDDWRRNPNYQGLSANPASTDTRKTANGNFIVPSYHQVLNPNVSLYGDTDSEGNPRVTTRPDGSTYQKSAFKFGLQDVSKQWSKFFIVDDNGEMDYAGKNLTELFYKAPMPKDLRKTITPAMAKDEVEFINAVQDLKNKQSLQDKIWITDNILCIVATGKDKYTGQKNSYRWINPNINVDKLDINKAEFDQFVAKETAEITKETSK